VLSYGLDDQGFKFPQGLGIFLFTTVFRLALGLMQPPIQWVPGALSLGVKWLGHEADYSPQSSAVVKNAWSYTSTSSTPSWHGAQLKHRDNFTFTFAWIGEMKNAFKIFVTKPQGRWS
jgi:hypothetical protein